MSADVEVEPRDNAGCFYTRLRERAAPIPPRPEDEHSPGQATRSRISPGAGHRHTAHHLSDAG